MKRLNIDLGERSYEILIGQGLLPETAKHLRQWVSTNKTVVITHPNIRALYGEVVETSLTNGGFSVDWVEVPEGEESKTLDWASRVFDRLVEFRCDRKTALIALGGGVIGDLTGFIAATFMRGIPFVQIPSTLLSQVDSSVGGKTAVNHPKGKNLIGAFYQPKGVLIDTDMLNTLAPEEFRSGLAEVIKYGVIEDAKLFEYLEQHAQDILDLDTGCLEHIIETSCAIKARVVERDERESQYRMVLNFGHTVGHAVEALMNYSGVKHGEAVAMGMVSAARISHRAGKCAESVIGRIRSLVEKMGLPSQLPALNGNDMVEAMRLDKKATSEGIKFILVNEIGNIEIVDGISESLLHEVLDN